MRERPGWLLRYRREDVNSCKICNETFIPSQSDYVDSPFPVCEEVWLNGCEREASHI